METRGGRERKSRVRSIEERRVQGIEALSVEVIGKILSHGLEFAEVVRASGTCRKWREAARFHLSSLLLLKWKQDSVVCKKLITLDLEVLLTQTILQTSGLLHLRLCSEQGFSAATVISWLLHTRYSLQTLHYALRVLDPTIRAQCLHAKVLETCGKMKCLNVLYLFNVQVMDVDFAVQRWPSLLSLGFGKVSISASDLNSLLLACPNLQSFGLSDPTILSMDARSTLTLTSSSLEHFRLMSTTTRLADNIILVAEVLTSLELDRCTLQHFGLVTKGNLRILRIKRTRISKLDIGPDTSKLEVLHVTDSTSPWPEFGHLISKVPNLEVLRLRGLESRAYSTIMNLEKIARSFPRLTQLAMALDDELMKGNVDQVLLPCNSLLDKLAVLELESTTIINDRFCCWIQAFLKICPSLNRLLVHGKTQQAQDATGKGNPNSVGGFFTSLIKLARKFPKVDILILDV